jgi:nitrite reductase/ring-hydroxylating ferredoxin subunit
MSENAEKYTRRVFLKLVRTGLLTLSGLLGLGGLLRFFSYQSQPPAQTEFVLGAPEDYAVGSRTLLPQVPALLVHSATGFTVLSLVCPHLGCTVEPQPNGFTCPCHGSRFDQRGQVTHGPASQALTILHLETAADGKLHLFMK